MHSSVGVTVLQSRELEKGTHLREEIVDAHVVEVPDGRLERVTKDDVETYFRLPRSADLLDRGETALAYGTSSRSSNWLGWTRRCIDQPPVRCRRGWQRSVAGLQRRQRR